MSSKDFWCLSHSFILDANGTEQRRTSIFSPGKVLSHFRVVLLKTPQSVSTMKELDPGMQNPASA
jgi:hypothetical protein